MTGLLFREPGVMGTEIPLGLILSFLLVARRRSIFLDEQEGQIYRMFEMWSEVTKDLLIPRADSGSPGTAKHLTR